MKALKFLLTLATLAVTLATLVVGAMTVCEVYGSHYISADDEL